MCILFLALDQHPDYPLILCANRDEFHHRPTAPAHFWPPQQQLLAGKDLQAGVPGLAVIAWERWPASPISVSRSLSRMVCAAAGSWYSRRSIAKRQ